MKKNIFFIAFLGLAGVCMTACSSGDDLDEQKTIVTPGNTDNSSKVVTLTGTLNSGSDNTTRAVGADGRTITWTAGDHILIQYEQTGGGFASADGTITKVDDHHATFTASLSTPKNGGRIGLAYPYEKVIASTSSYNDFTFTYTNDELYNQVGTTEGITDAKLDYAKTEAEVTMDVDGSTATLHRNATLENQTCIYKFNIVDIDGSTALTATKLLIEYGSIKYTITPSTTAASTFFVAMQPKEETTNTVKISAILDGSKILDADGVNSMTSSDVGKFICRDDKNHGYQGYLCNNKTTAAKSNVHTYAAASTFVKGKFYEKTLQARELTPEAVVTNVGGVSGYWTKFLALALEDVYTDETKSLHDASAYLMGENNWAKQHQMKISNTTYDDAYSSVYDQVRDNTLDANKVIISTYASNSNSGSPADKGWRTPSVTDIRYILHELKKDEDNYLIDHDKISATSPTGITDQNGFYYSGQASDTNGYAMYSTGGGASWTYINNLCGSSGDTDIKNNYYWLSSQVINKSGSSQDQKAWRFSFSADQFEWNENADESWLRLVFAY